MVDVGDDGDVADVLVHGPEGVRKVRKGSRCEPLRSEASRKAASSQEPLSQDKDPSNSAPGPARKRFRAESPARCRKGLYKSAKARESKFAGQRRGWVLATHSFPVAQHWALSLSRAVCSPTLLTAACGAVGLIAGPSRPFRARDLSSEASSPGSAPPAGGSLAGRVLARLHRLHFAPAP